MESFIENEQITEAFAANNVKSQCFEDLVVSMAESGHQNVVEFLPGSLDLRGEGSSQPGSQDNYQHFCKTLWKKKSHLLNYLLFYHTLLFIIAK